MDNSLMIKHLTLTIVILTGCNLKNGKYTVLESESGMVATKLDLEHGISSKEALNLYNRALTKFSRENFSGSLEELEKANELEPNNATILNAIALSKLKLRNVAGAVQYHKLAIRADSTCYHCYTNLGLAYYYLGSYQSGLDYLYLVKDSELTGDNRFGNYYHRLMNYAELVKCDSVEKYSTFMERSNLPTAFRNNYELMKEKLFDKKCPQQLAE